MRLNSKDPLEQLHGVLDFQRLLLLNLAAEHGSPFQIERRSPSEQLLYGIRQNPARRWTVKGMAQFCQMDCEKFRWCIPGTHRIAAENVYGSF